MRDERIQLTKNILLNFVDAYNFLIEDCDGELDDITLYEIDKKYLRIDFVSLGGLEKNMFDKLKKKLRKRFDKVKIKITEKEKDLAYLWINFSGSVFVSLENLWSEKDE